MQIGLNLPVMVPGLDRAAVRAWCRAIDEGPFSCLAAGERYHFPNLEMQVTLAAACAWTERVPILYNVLVLPLHPEVLAAKQVASLDVLSGGRVRLAVGVGAREEDFRGLGVTYDNKRLSTLERRVERMRRMWAGEKAFPEALRPVEPAPLRPGGPEILAGSLAPSAIRRAARWADGICGFSFTLEPNEVGVQFETARAAWREADRPSPPKLVTGCWFALGPDPRAQMDEYLRRYLAFFGGMEEYLIPAVPVGAAALRDQIRRARDLGADELVLAPTTADPDEVARLADVIAEAGSDISSAP